MEPDVSRRPGQPDRRTVPTARARARGLLAVVAGAACCTGSVDAAAPAPAEYARWAQPRIASLADLSIEALRSRRYGSELRIAEARGGGRRGRYLAEYLSDGQRVYTRIDVPGTPMPPQGYPTVLFLHGWSSNDDAPAFDFAQGEDGQYGQVIDAFVAAGFVVLYPGWRGYGTVGGRPADGAGFLAAWNNASYLAPSFFAIDVLNLLDGLDSLAEIDWRRWGYDAPRAVRIDPRSIHLAGHSQGGDVVLTVLAVAGEGSRVRTAIASGSIWAGCFAGRFEQLETYGPMEATREAFLAGDGTWNGTATGSDGAVNPNFVFGWPPDWILTPDPASPGWTWQEQRWPVPTVEAALRRKYTEMYAALNRNVADLGHASFVLTARPGSRVAVTHDPAVAAAMARIGGHGYPQYLREPLALHFSDRDFYSPPTWNEDLSRRINATGGRSVAYLYPGNTHSLGRSGQAWFSPPDTQPGFRLMLDRDIALFRDSVSAPRELPPTIAELRLRTAPTRLEFVRELAPGPGYSAYLVAYPSAGLRVHAMVAVPTSEMPATGYPVLVANHGTHPDPPRYGFTAAGVDSRPGDYYRSVPELYTARGFLVVMPDYRGHNSSEGREYARGFLASNYYAEDVLALVAGLPTLARADTRNVFMWGHSLGGEVALKALLATDRIRAASLWSTVGGGIWEQAYLYSLRGREAEPFDSSDAPKEAVAALQRDLGSLGAPWDDREAEPLRHLDRLATPLILHHAREDASTPFEWSRELAQQLDRLGKPYVLHAYAGDAHFLEGEDRRLAAERDAAFFRSRMAGDGSP